MSYLTTIIADAPDHYWRMADPGGFLCHDIGSAPHTIAATPSANLPYTGPNSDGGSCAIPGTGGPRTIDTISLPSPRALECWWFPITFPASMVVAGFDSVAANQWGISTDGTAHLAMSVNGTNMISGTVVTRELWHHIVATYDGANGRLYYDGVLVAGPTAIAAPANVARQLTWGSQPSGALAAFGAISECATYPVNLSAARVTAHYAAADATLVPPVYKGGAFSLDVAVTSLSSSDVYGAVHKVFPTT